MAKENEDVAGTDEPGVTIDADEINPNEPAETDTGDDAEEVDFEALMLEEATTAPPEPSESEEEIEKSETTEKPAGDRASDILLTLKSLAAKLDALPESQDANFKRLREINRTLTGRLTTELEDYRAKAENLSRFGDEKVVRERLELVDSLYRYDVKSGTTNPDQFAEAVVKQDVNLGYRTAINILKQEVPGSPNEYVGDHFCRNVLKIDPARLEEFQALSRGEIPEGYEGAVKPVKDEDLARIPAEFHDAYKRLTPGLLEKVKEGFGQYASKVEQVEATQILRGIKADIDQARREEEEAAKAEANFNADVEKYTNTHINEAFEQTGSLIERALQKITFSSNPAQNATMQFGVQKAIFGIENPMLRNASVRYFKAIGIPEKVVQEKIAESVKILDNLDAEIEVLAHATARGQKTEANRARERYNDHVTALARLGINLAAQAAKATGAAIMTQKAKTSVPTNEQPTFNRTSSDPAGQQRRYTAADYAAASAAGKVLK